MPKGPRKFQFSFEKTGLTLFSELTVFQSFCKISGAPFSFSLEGEGQDEGVRHRDSPSPLPSPAGGRGSDLILTLSQSAKLLIFSLSERHEN